MATPVILGVGAIAAAITARHLARKGLFAGKGAAEQWVKGGFKAKMDRKEAIAILGLKYVPFNFSLSFVFRSAQFSGLVGMAHKCETS
jgi:hypothetical protein